MQVNIMNHSTAVQPLWSFALVKKKKIVIHILVEEDGKGFV